MASDQPLPTKFWPSFWGGYLSFMKPALPILAILILAGVIVKWWCGQ